MPLHDGSGRAGQAIPAITKSDGAMNASLIILVRQMLRIPADTFLSFTPPLRVTAIDGRRRLLPTAIAADTWQNGRSPSDSSHTS